MKKLIFYALIVLCFNCTIQYDGDTRFVVNGQIIDRNNNPIPNHDIELWVYTDSNGYGSDSDFISFTKTNDLGLFEMVFPKAKGNIVYEIQTIDASNIFQNKRISRIGTFNFNEDYTFSLQNPLTLLERTDISTLNITLNNVNPNNQIIDISIDGILANDRIIINPSDTNYTYYYDYYYNPVAKNQTVTVNYEVRDNSTQSTFTLQEIYVIGNDDTYEFTLDY